jgi:hypothetical protein
LLSPLDVVTFELADVRSAGMRVEQVMGERKAYPSGLTDHRPSRDPAGQRATTSRAIRRSNTKDQIAPPADVSDSRSG